MQNVVVQYTLATAWERVLAFVIDLMILAATVSLLFLPLRSMSPATAVPYICVVIVPVALFYSLAFELFNAGRTPGKAAMRLRVMRIDGRPVGLLDYLMRWVFRGLEVYFSIGTVAYLGVISSRYSQRIGDFFANTVVVSLGKSDRVQLSQLLALDKHIQRTITYPQSVRLTESTALLVKETLDRSRMNDNEAHQAALKLLASRVRKQLQVRGAEDPRAFLETVLGDYVVLTR